MLPTPSCDLHCFADLLQPLPFSPTCTDLTAHLFPLQQPWIARFAVILLDRLLDPGMLGPFWTVRVPSLIPTSNLTRCSSPSQSWADMMHTEHESLNIWSPCWADMRCLEWSTGSSTLWVLMRVKHLISIEHHARWADMVATQLSQIFSAEVRGVMPNEQPFLPSVLEHHDACKRFGKPTSCVAAQDLKQRWQLHAVEPLPNTSERGPDKEDPIKFKCAAQCTASLPLPHPLVVFV
jgi:hypothetical protein